MGLGAIVLLVAGWLVGCTSSHPSSQPDAQPAVGGLSKGWEADVGLDPILAAPPLDASRVFAQSIDPRSRRALLSGLGGAAAEGVTQVCAVNRRSGARACFEARDTKFSGVIEDTVPRDTVTLWGDGPGYLPGGPGINSIDTEVQHWVTRFPAAISALALVEGNTETRGGLYIADAGVGLFFLDQAQLDNDPQTVSFRRWTRLEGLSSNDILSLAPDLRGGLLIGTQEGLDRLSHAAGEPRVSAIFPPPVSVPQMQRDRNGDLWVAADGLGIVRIRTRDSGEEIATYGTESGLPSNRVTAVAPDGEGGAWFFRGGGWVELGHLTLDQQELPRVVMTDLRAILSHPPSSRLLADGRGGTWFSEDGVLFHVEAGEAGFAIRRYGRAEGFDVGRVSDIARDPSGNLFLASDRGLIRLAFEGGVAAFTHVSTEPTRTSIFGAAGEIWSGTETGVVRFPADGSAGGSLRYWDDDGTLPANFIDSLLADSRGAWVISGSWFGRGRWLSRMTLEDKVASFRNLHLPESPRVMLRDGENSVWVGTGNGRLVRVVAGAVMAVADAIPLFANPDPLRPEVNGIAGLARSGRGGIWALSRGGALAHVDLSADPAVVTRHETGLSQGRGIAAQGESVWAFGHCEGLLEIRMSDGLPVRRRYTLSDGLPSDCLNAVLAERPGAVWVASNSALSLALSGAGDLSFRNFAHPGERASYLHPGDASGWFWISDGTPSGTWRVREADGRLAFERLEVPAELGFRANLPSIVRFEDGLLLGTSRGLFLLPD